MDPVPLTLELERAALHALAAEWRNANGTHFRNLLRPPLLALSSGGATLGRWIARTRTLELDRALILGHPWTTVCEVLRHEMAHQFVDEALNIHDQTAHGAAFQRVCADRGIDARAAGLPEPTGAVGDSRHKVIERVAKLLALAASASEHEAHTAMNAAQRLMLEHNIAAVTAEPGRRFVSKELGEPTGRMEEARSLIAVLLAEHFFVQAIRVRVWRVREATEGTVLEVTGTPENVAMAEYVYAFLDRTADALWVAHKKAHRVTGDRARRAFRAGVVMGFGAKLAEQRSTHQERGLVWVGDPELAAHYRRRYPRIAMVRTGGAGDVDARRHGEAAGRTVVLSRGVEGGSTGSSGAPRRLGDGRG